MKSLFANKVVRFFVISDFFLMSAWGLITPILAIFVVDFIETDNPAMVIGIAVGVYWITKAILQIPISGMLDKIRGERDDFYALMVGMLITAFVPLGFIFATQPFHMYGLQVVHAIGMAMVIPAWSGIFTRHMNSGHEAMSWGIDSSALSFGAGIAGIAGGILVVLIGFTPLFLSVTVLGIFSTILIWVTHGTILHEKKYS